MDRLNDEELWGRTKKAIEDIINQMNIDGEISSEVDREVLLTDVLNEALVLGPGRIFSERRISEIMVNHASQIYIEERGNWCCRIRCFPQTRQYSG